MFNMVCYKHVIFIIIYFLFYNSCAVKDHNGVRKRENTVSSNSNTNSNIINNSQDSSATQYEGKLIKGNKNAIFVVENGVRRMFPDFNTFSKLGYEITKIHKIPDDVLNSIPLGPIINSIPVFRPEDYMYHVTCDDPTAMVSITIY